MFVTAQMDFPWMERGGGKIKRGADRHYPLVPTHEGPDLIWSSPLWYPAPDAHLYMWVTDNFLKDGLWLMDTLGFRYIRTFQWVKVKGRPKRLDFETGWAVEPVEDIELRYGIGQYARGAHEMMLFGVRGKGMVPRTDRRDIPSAFFAPVHSGEDGKRVHSRKPDAAYELIEARSKGPYAEFFARRNRPGWSAWGNEVKND
jgi:N6-adenosine-specific RNA methylase IME4